MKDFELLYKIKELEKNIVIYITKDDNKCNDFLPLTPAQIRIVDYILKNNRNNIYQRDLEKNLNLTRATISGVLKTMEKNGILKRTINSNDARSKQIILNEKIERHFDEINYKLSEIEKILTKDVSEEELTIFREVLNKMKTNISNYNTDYERND